MVIIFVVCFLWFSVGANTHAAGRRVSSRRGDLQGDGVLHESDIQYVLYVEVIVIVGFLQKYEIGCVETRIVLAR